MAMMKSPRERVRADRTGIAGMDTPLDKWAMTKEINVVASSYDPRHPPESVLDGSHSTFWVSTGMFPQVMVIGFKEEIKISELKTTTRNLRSISIDRIIPGQAMLSGGKLAWKNVVNKDLVDVKNKMQVEVFTMNNLPCRFIKVTLLSGFDIFAAVYTIRIQTTDGKWIC